MGITTSEVGEKDTYNLAFGMVAMKFIAEQQRIPVTQRSDTVAT